jgi:hypothetical protein
MIATGIDARLNSPFDRLAQKGDDRIATTSSYSGSTCMVLGVPSMCMRMMGTS